MWQRILHSVTTYFTRKPMFGPGIMAEFSVTIERRGGDGMLFVRMHDWNHENLDEVSIVQAFLDSMITSLQKKGANKRNVMEYIDARWKANVGVVDA